MSLNLDSKNLSQIIPTFDSIIRFFSPISIELAIPKNKLIKTNVVI